MNAPRDFGRFPIEPSLFKLSPLLLDLEERGRSDPRRYLDTLLAWSSGKRSLVEAGHEYRKSRDLIRAARCCIEAQEASAEPPDLLRDIEHAFTTLRTDAEARLQGVIEGAATLRAEAILGPSAGEVDPYLSEAKALFDRLPTSSSPRLCHALAALEPDALRKLEDAVGLAELALEEGQQIWQQRQREKLAELRGAKRDVDRHLNEFWERPDLGAEQSHALEVVNARTGECMGRRDLDGLRRLLGLIQRIADGEAAAVLLELGAAPPPSPSPQASIWSRPAGATAPRRFTAHQLTGLAKKSLGAEAQEKTKQAPADLPAIEPIAFSPLNWDMAELGLHREHARKIVRMAPNDPAVERALGEYLMAEGKLRLLDDKPLQAATFFLDAFRWAASSSVEGAERQRDIAASSLLLATLFGYLPSEERRERLKAPDLTTAVQRRAMASLLPELDGRGILGEQARVAAQMGAREGAIYLDTQLLPYLSERPRAAQDFVERAISDLAEGLDGSNLISPLLELLALTLERLLPDLHLTGEPGLQALLKGSDALRERGQRAALGELLQRFRGFVLPLAERHDLAGITADRLKEQAEGLERPTGQPFALSHSLLTPAIVLGRTPKAVLQLSLPMDAQLLRNVQVEVELVDAFERSLPGAFKAPPLLARLEPKERREVPLPFYRFDLPRDVKLRVRYWSLSLEGVARAIDVRVTQFSITLEAPPERPREARNPYIVGSPVQDLDRIYGREKEVEEIGRVLAGERQDNIVLVTGERRIGKTTLLNAVEQHPDFQKRYLIVRGDLQTARHERSLAVLLRARLLGRIRSQLKDAGVDLPPIHEARFEESPASAFEDFMREVDRALEARDRRLLIILDELDQLLENKALGAEAIAALRAVILAGKRTSFLLAGATEILRHHTATREDRLFRLAIEVKIKPLDERAARRLVQEPSRGYYELTEFATDLILRETNRQPYLLQYVCSILFQQMRDRSARTVTETDVEEIFTSLVVPRTEVFYDFIASIPVSPVSEDSLNLLIVKAMAALQQGNRYVATTDLRRELGRMGKAVPEFELAERLRQIAQAAPLVVERRLTTHAYRLQVGLFARHLRFIQGDVLPG
jgi:AAA ATPase domain